MKNNNKFNRMITVFTVFVIFILESACASMSNIDSWEHISSYSRINMEIKNDIRGSLKTTTLSVAMEKKSYPVLRTALSGGPSTIIVYSDRLEFIRYDQAGSTSYSCRLQAYTGNGMHNKGIGSLILRIDNELITLQGKITYGNPSQTGVTDYVFFTLTSDVMVKLAKCKTLILQFDQSPHDVTGQLLTDLNKLFLPKGANFAFPNGIGEEDNKIIEPVDIYNGAIYVVRDVGMANEKSVETISEILFGSKKFRFVNLNDNTKKNIISLINRIYYPNGNGIFRYPLLDINDSIIGFIFYQRYYSSDILYVVTSEN